MSLRKNSQVHLPNETKIKTQEKKLPDFCVFLRQFSLCYFKKRIDNSSMMMKMMERTLKGWAKGKCLFVIRYPK